MSLIRRGAFFVGTLLAIAVFGALVNVRSIDPAAHTRVIANLGKLQLLDAEIDEIVLKLRAGWLPNYDLLVHTLALMEARARDLEQGPYALAGLSGGALDAEIAAVNAKLAEKEAVIERFKSRSAVLRNSLYYFPHSVDALVADPRTPQGLRSGAQDLMRDLLLVRFGPAPTDYETVGMKISLLREQLAAQAPAVRVKADVLLRHGQHALDSHAELDRLVQAITSTSARQTIDSLAEAYNRMFERRLHEANIYRFALVLASLCLLVYTALPLLGSKESSASAGAPARPIRAVAERAVRRA